MTGNRALLTNFVEKFLGTVRFGNNDFAVIAGYGDVVIGSMTIKKFTIRTNADGGVHNRPAEDGRVHIVEPRAREALKDVWCEVVPMYYISYSEDHELAKDKGVGIAFLDAEEESIECYALIAKPTSRAEDRWDAIALRDKG
nr:integrase, catalytic region, zinc finger, CCHC-type, peptidase aspartic, catalytic [Tanacetum cinerariifolium]